MPNSFNHFKGWLCYYPHCEDGWARVWEAKSCQSCSATWQQSQVCLQPCAVYHWGRDSWGPVSCPFSPPSLVTELQCSFMYQCICLHDHTFQPLWSQGCQWAVGRGFWVGLLRLLKKQLTGKMCPLLLLLLLPWTRM